MPRGGAVNAPNELATILYYASRGFTPEAIRYFLRKKTGRDHIWIALITDTMKRFSAEGGFNGKPQIFDSITRMWHLDGVDNKIEELWGASEGGIAHITTFTLEDEFAVLEGEFGEPASMRGQLRDNLRNLGWGVPREPGIMLKMIPIRDMFLPYAGPGAVGRPKGEPRPHPVPILPPPPPTTPAPVTAPEADYKSPYSLPPGGWIGSASSGSREVNEYESPYPPPPGG
ncbi:hypothetical protein BDR22DRAFT_890694 [Usnea florida]